jgi:SET domain-containing protein
MQCCCKRDCDESCLNRISKIECCEIGSRSLCGVADKRCSNRQFSSRQYVKVQPFQVTSALLLSVNDLRQEGSMGWGLRALEDVPRGTLVIEYVGEVISETQMRVRISPSNLPLKLSLSSSLSLSLLSFSLSLPLSWSRIA